MSSFQEINSLTDNCAETFEFSSEDAQRILFPTVHMESMNSSEDIKVRLERLYHKETRLVMHGSTLSEYWRNKKIPRGLRIQKAPTIGKSDENFTKKWGEILNKCSLDLMLLIIDQVSTEAKTVRTEIEKTERELRDKFGPTFGSIESSIKETINGYKEKLLNIKLKKYKRDTEDYQRNEVYHWETEKRTLSPQASTTTRSRTGAFGPRRRGPTPDHRRDTSQNDSSMESDFTFDSDSGIPPSNPFLQSRGKQVHNPRRNADLTGGPKGPGRQPWTRSHSRTR